MTPCIEHTQKGDKDGYGHGRVGTNTNVALHRLAYCKGAGVELSSIQGSVVRHRCDNPRCINPDHLQLGSVADNNTDRNVRKRTAHQLTTAEVEAIRELYAAGGITQRKLGAMFGTTHSNISVIVNRKTRIHAY